MQVNPSELEGKLLEHPNVADCAVVGRQDHNRATELPTAFVVLSPEARAKDRDTATAEIITWLNANVANHKRLRGGVRLVDSVPKTASGKILRRLLRDQLASSARQAKL